MGNTVTAALIAVSTFGVSGCSGVNVKSYEGTVLPPGQLALVFTQHIEGAQTKIFALDGDNLPYVATRILELTPGLHQFTIFSSPWPKKDSGRWGFLKNYELNPYREYSVHLVTAELRAGFTYVPVSASRGTLDEPARQVCLAEEPHDAPGARLNVSGELRYPSAKAILVGCSGRQPLPPGHADRYPDWRQID